MRTLLVLDDDPLIGDLVGALGVSAGYVVQVLTASEGLLETLRARPVDVLVLDIVMPGMDGLEVLEALGREGYRGAILLLSGQDELYLHAADRMARRAGLNCIGAFPKPFKPEALLGLLAGL